MNGSGEPPPAAARAGQRGNARLKFLLVLAGIAALVYVGGQFVPARYHAWTFERFMQDTVNTAVMTNKPPAWAEQQLRRNLEEYGMPEDASVEVVQDGSRMAATVRFTQPISLVVTEYEYDFDVSVRSVRVAGGQ